MAITTTTTNDLNTQQSTLIILQSATQVEQIVYDASSNTLAFHTEPSFSLTASDFLKFYVILNAFLGNILQVFSATPFSFSKFNIVHCEDQDTGFSMLFNLVQNFPVYNITCSYPSGTINFGARNVSPTLTCEEFVYFMNAILHFEQRLKKNYSL